MYRQAPYITFKDLEKEFKEKEEKILLQEKKIAISFLKAKVKKSGLNKIMTGSEAFKQVKELLDNPPTHVVSFSHTALTNDEIKTLQTHKNLSVSRYITIYFPTQKRSFPCK